MLVCHTLRSDPSGPRRQHAGAQRIGAGECLERAVTSADRTEGIALRDGGFYGPPPRSPSTRAARRRTRLVAGVIRQSWRGPVVAWLLGGGAPVGRRAVTVSSRRRGTRSRRGRRRFGHQPGSLLAVRGPGQAPLRPVAVQLARRDRVPVAIGDLHVGGADRPGVRDTAGLGDLEDVSAQRANVVRDSLGLGVDVESVGEPRVLGRHAHRTLVGVATLRLECTRARTSAPAPRSPCRSPVPSPPPRCRADRACPSR